MQMYVLALENSENDLSLLTRHISDALGQLGEHRLSVKGFVHPEEALKFMEQNECHILFVGTELCGMDSFRMAKTVQERYPDCHIVLVTAYEQHALEALQMHLRLSGYLMRPVTAQAIEAQLKNMPITKKLSKNATLEYSDVFQERIGEICLKIT